MKTKPFPALVVAMLLLVSCAAATSETAPGSIGGGISSEKYTASGSLNSTNATALVETGEEDEEEGAEEEEETSLNTGIAYEIKVKEEENIRDGKRPYVPGVEVPKPLIDDGILTISDILRDPHSYEGETVKLTVRYGGRIFAPLCSPYYGPRTSYYFKDDTGRIAAKGKVENLEWAGLDSEMSVKATVMIYSGRIGCADSAVSAVAITSTGRNALVKSSIRAGEVVYLDIRGISTGATNVIRATGGTAEPESTNAGEEGPAQATTLTIGEAVKLPETMQELVTRRLESAAKLTPNKYVRNVRSYSIPQIQAKGTVLMDDGLHPASLLIIERVTAASEENGDDGETGVATARGYLRVGARSFVMKDVIVDGGMISATILGGTPIVLERTTEEGFEVIKGSMELGGSKVQIYLVL